MDLKKYIAEFEIKVVVPCIEQGMVGKSVNVSVRQDKLSAKQFGRKIGGTIDTDLIVVVDYYGLKRKSRGFENMVMQLQNAVAPRQVKNAHSILVHFSSIKIDDMARVTTDTNLLGRFPMFKNELVRLRWRK